MQQVEKYQEHKAGMPVPMDMSEIYKYEALVEDLAGVNLMNGPFYMREFLKAKELASSFYCRLLFDYEQARNRTRTEQALAYLERSEDYIKARGLKSTDETKKQYVAIDKGYQAAKDKEDMLKALVTLMENKVYKFQAAHDDAKKIFDSLREPRGSISSAQSHPHAQ